MAKNDILLIDGIIEERKKLNIPADNGEVFEFFSAEQILKDYDLSFEEIKNGSVDGENDGGIDYWYTFINGHLIEESYEAFPRVNASMEVYIISCKHHNTFKQSVLDIMFPTLVEIFDLSITKEEMRGQYNNELLDKRKLFIKTYKKVASALINFKIHVIYASRGDENLLEENIKSRARQLESCIAHNFSDCICGVDFYGRSQLLKLYRKQRKSLLVLPYTEILTNGCNHIAITKIEDYYSFIKDEDGKLRRYLFDSNVRAYMGLNRVNNDIMETLQNQESPNFWLLNNGVTILATKASIIGKEIEIENVQIVNGLQTSETIYNYFSNFNIILIFFLIF